MPTWPSRARTAAAIVVLSTGWWLSADVALGARGAAPAAFDKSDVRRVISAAHPHFSMCYREAVGRNPAATGKVTVGFTVTELGRTRKGKIVGTSFKDPLFHTCLIEVVNRLEFQPWPRKAIRITYPLVFRPEQL